MGWGFGSRRSSSKSEVPATVPKPSENDTDLQITQWFEQFYDAESDAIQVDGMEKFCASINVDPSDVKMLVLSWKLGAKAMCEFSREEFVGGLRKQRVRDSQQLRSAFNKWEKELEDIDAFKSFYRFAFKYGLEPNQKGLEISVAKAYIDLLLCPRYKHAQKFLEFLEEKKFRGLNEDQWNLLLTFCTTINDDYSNYDLDSAWPLILDEFVMWAKGEEH